MIGAVLLTLVLLLVTGCVIGNPTTANPQVANPAATKAPFLAPVLEMRIDPKNAAWFTLNPTPLGKGSYPRGLVVTIDILPKEGWQVDEWLGPVFNIVWRTAKIQMDSCKLVVARMKRTAPIAIPTDTPNAPTPPPLSTYTPIPEAAPTATPWIVQVTATPRPKAIHRPTATPNAISYHNKGRDYCNDGKYPLARNEFTTEIRLTPSYTKAYGMRGNAYTWLGQYQQAIRYCDKSIQLDPNDAMAYNNRGYACRGLGQNQRATQGFDIACSLDSKYC